MTSPFAQRATALAAAALLAAVFAVALADAHGRADTSELPRPAVGPWGGWSTAQAGVARSVRAGGEPSACGWIVTRRSFGVLHPVLPCGAQLFLEYGGSRVLTRVIGRGPVPQGRQFDVTPALAKRIHLRGVREIHWAYAQG